MKHVLITTTVLFLLLFNSCKEKETWYSGDFGEHHKKAQALYAGADKNVARNYLDSVYNDVFIKAPDVQYLYCTFLVQYYSAANNLDSAQIYADSAVAILEQRKRYQKHSDEYIHALLDRGYVLSLKGENDKAYECYVKAEVIASSKLDVCSRNEYNYHIGMSLYKQRKYRLALQYFDRAFADADVCTDAVKPYYRMQEILDNMGLCCMYLKQYDSSIFYFDSGLAYVGKYGKKMGNKKTYDLAEAVLYRNKASSLACLSQFDTAEKMFLKCIDIVNRPGYDSAMGVASQISLAGVYQLLNRYDKMYDLLKKTKVDVDRKAFSKYAAYWKEWMFIYYDSTKQYKQALDAYTDFVLYRDSISREDAKVSVDVVSALKDKQQQYQITILKKDNEVSRLYLWATIGFCLLLLVIVLLGQQFYRKSKQKNKQINSQKEALERSNREKDRILHVVAHDLRNPIGNISYIADTMLMEDGSSLPADEAMQMIKDASTQSLHLVNELLGVSNGATEDIAKENTDIVELVNSCVVSLRYKAAEKKQELVYNKPGGAIDVSINSDGITRVLNNLITNAIKFTAQNGYITISLAKDMQTLAISVADTGIGIPAELIPSLFEMFTESKRKGTANERSYGLGLSICKRITEQHGGALIVKSVVNKGTTFTVQLPLNTIQ